MYKINNNLELIKEENNIIYCKCKICGYLISNSIRNLSYKKFKCKYCILISKSDLIKSKEVSILDINGSIISLKCKNNHIYKQNRGNLLSNRNCNQCRVENKSLKLDDIITTLDHDNYIYDFSNFKNSHTKIKIQCKKGHIFYQKFSNHLQGKGCSICRESKGEFLISKILKNNNINFFRQKTFIDCIYKSKLKFDFWIEDNNLLIEYDGIQHYKPMIMFGGEEEFEKTKIKDKIKDQYCIDNNINLLRISYLDNIYDKLNTIYKNIIL